MLRGTGPPQGAKDLAAGLGFGRGGRVMFVDKRVGSSRGLGFRFRV